MTDPSVSWVGSAASHFAGSAPYVMNVIGRKKLWDTVGQPPSAEIGVPNLPSLKAKKLKK
jgi:hypothetical protein